jgi:hypothetical protein
VRSRQKRASHDFIAAEAARGSDFLQCSIGFFQLASSCLQPQPFDEPCRCNTDFLAKDPQEIPRTHRDSCSKSRHLLNLRRALHSVLYKC